ncbi:hypothetical protein V1525DRAFT_340787 [Lipomyces kononenkoae]|uniref:Uncharacterized protein n=1 Tax=Lipomyces kononenkoae TaxID=34357 RepID=A0ACC3T521_LIPKO
MDNLVRSEFGTDDVELNLRQINADSVDDSSKSSADGQDALEQQTWDSTLPGKQGSRIYRWLRFTAFSHYRKLFTLVFIANLIGAVIFLVRYSRTDFGAHIALAQNICAANIFAAALVRNEHVVNLLFLLCACVPRSAPLWLRDHLARVFHYGGLHSGSGVSGVIWFAIYWALVVKETVRHGRPNTPGNIAILVISSICLAVLIIIPLSAYPKLRIRYHNYFECLHRFLGWTAVILFWVLLFVSIASTSKALGRPYGVCLYKSAAFWFLVLITLLIVYPWTRLRKRQVFPEVLSSHAIRLRFDYAPVALCQGIRVSTSPLLEWHSFATIPDPRSDKGFSLIVSKAGDWTSLQIKQQPVRLWVRGAPIHGVLRIATIFNRIVVVATGSGIGPCLSLLSPYEIPCRILWCTRDPILTYGQAIVDEVYRADPDAVVINASKGRRPDMVLETYKLVRQIRAEAVFVIANPSATRKVVYGMRSRGICAYGPIWDS